MSADDAKRQRLEELLVARAVEGLDPAETAEVERLLAATSGVDPDAYDEAAAWFWLGSADAGPMPADVAERARRTLSGEQTGGARVSRPPTPPRGRRAWRGGAGWVAAAAVLVIAIAGWWPRLEPSRPPDLAAARAQLLEKAPDAVRVNWTSTDDPRAQGVSGYVVWSDVLQKGYMTFRGIPPNDPSEHQYQLWVFDAARSDKYPVDGGVFNAQRNGNQVIVPIHAKLPVRHATLFAVTLEPPGGVVVSDRDPLLWLAKPGATSSS